MRGMGGSRKEKSDYDRGFEHGVIASVSLIAGLFLMNWVFSNPVVKEVTSWATTAQVAPVDLVVLAVTAVSIWTIMMLFRGVRA